MVNLSTCLFGLLGESVMSQLIHKFHCISLSMPTVTRFGGVFDIVIDRLVIIKITYTYYIHVWISSMDCKRSSRLDKESLKKFKEFPRY